MYDSETRRTNSTFWVSELGVVLPDAEVWIGLNVFRNANCYLMVRPSNSIWTFDVLPESVYHQGAA